MSLQAVVSEIDRHASFIVTSHVAPEGDAVGSAMALALALKALGKSAEVALRDPVPRQLAFLPSRGLVYRKERIVDPADALIAVDCGDLHRTGFFFGERPPVGRIINIDHHITNHKFGDVNWVDASAASTGEMVYDLLVELKIPITPGIAAALYTSIASETGSYHYVNTTPKVFRMAADLVERGADPVAIARSLFESQTEGRLRLMAEVFSGLRLDSGGKLAWIRATLPMLEATGTDPEDTENLINYASFIEGVEVALLFRQIDPESFKVSLRSRGRVDVSRIATRFGGGGHRYASGCVVRGEIAPVEERVLAAVREEISRCATAS
jgi:phosphoesterase RecJ-like protein